LNQLANLIDDQINAIAIHPPMVYGGSGSWYATYIFNPALAASKTESKVFDVIMDEKTRLTTVHRDDLAELILRVAERVGDNDFACTSFSLLAPRSWLLAPCSLLLAPRFSPFDPRPSPLAPRPSLLVPEFCGLITATLGTQQSARSTQHSEHSETTCTDPLTHYRHPYAMVRLSSAPTRRANPCGISSTPWSAYRAVKAISRLPRSLMIASLLLTSTLHSGHVSTHFYFYIPDTCRRKLMKTRSGSSSMGIHDIAETLAWRGARGVVPAQNGARRWDGCVLAIIPREQGRGGGSRGVR
jgi:hypothetical protein